MASNEFNVLTAKNKLLIALLLLVFAGQTAVANAVACQLPTNPMPMPMSILDSIGLPNTDLSEADLSSANLTNHSTHLMDEAEQASDSNIILDCCAENISCPMNGCVAMALPGVMINPTRSIFSQKILTPIKLVLSQVISSPYRPPILS